MSSRKFGIIVLVLTGLMFGIPACLFLVASDNVVPEESELSRYPELEIFFPGRTTFRGIIHNLDTGDYSFAFRTSLPTPDAFFVKVRGNAERAGWNVEASKRFYSFRKKSRAYPAANYDEVALSFSAENGEIIFFLRRAY